MATVSQLPRSVDIHLHQLISERAKSDNPRGRVSPEEHQRRIEELKKKYWKDFEKGERNEEWEEDKKVSEVGRALKLVELNDEQK